MKITDLERKNNEKGQVLDRLKRRMKASEEKLEELARIREENKR